MSARIVREVLLTTERVLAGYAGERREVVDVQLGYHSITWGGVVGHAQGVTSAKDLYYLTYGSMEEAVRDIAAAGYTGTEMFDGNLAAYADRPDELRGLLAENGVELVSVYTGAGFVYPDVLPTSWIRCGERAS